MHTLANIFGLICAAANGALLSLSAVHAILVCVSIAMMQIDKSPENTWNCGVLIYSTEALILFSISLPFYFLAKFSLWSNPLKSTTWQLAAATSFLVAAGSYCYAFFRTAL
ncbi:MAG: hypothetical protein SFY67_14310 [Candidatus Melainabacteria bacterium]|nr:hypothetical protein [Candidatus Melainabacteria bacterium]